MGVFDKIKDKLGGKKEEKNKPFVEVLSPSQKFKKNVSESIVKVKNSKFADQLRLDAEEARNSPTARRIRALRNFKRDDARTQARAAVQSMFKKYLGVDLTDPNRFKRKSKETREIASKQIKEGDFGVQCFIVDNAGDIEDYYEVLNHHELGVGGTAFVVRGIERSTKAVRAIKKIDKRHVRDMHRVRQEISVMKSMDHPNVIKLFETFEDAKYLYLVMEICEGGDMLDKLRELTRFSELQSAIIMRIILCTVNYLHVNEIVHRDIKPDNFLFKQKSDDLLNCSIRLVDFGYSCKFGSGAQLSTKVGSPFYVSPEVLEGKYNEKCDVWSCGVICYLMLAGYPPFAGETDAETLNKVRTGEFSFNKRDWKHNDDSQQAKHLIRNLLRVDLEKRYTVEQALKHPWVKNRGVNRVEDMKDSTADRLMLYKNHHKLRKAAMLAVAYHLEEEDVGELRALFQGLDLNGDGLLTREEFIKGVNACGIDEANILQMIQSVDADGSGVIDYTEFLAATLEKRIYSRKHEACFLAFRTFDQDGGGTVDKEEVQETLGVEDDKEMDFIFEEVDLNKDGQMDYKEFHHMLRQEPQLEQSIEDEGEMMAQAEDLSGGGSGSDSGSGSGSGSDDEGGSKDGSKDGSKETS